MTVTVVYDACVLYPNTLRDLLIRVGQAGLVRARWTEKILDEVMNALKANRPDIVPAKLNRLRELMNQSIRDVLVTGYEGLEDGISLPDPDDRHVVAAAVRCHAELIVTANLRDFPEENLESLGVCAIGPDDFLADLVNLHEREVWACIQQIADSRLHPPESTEDVLNQLEHSGLIVTTTLIRST
ncbi:PIN domain-containing protein [Stackebrandtia albiflava]|uniref:PIN domain-containing protein n=1 Tax=Stackebrandtia albiflava TaxID=406432 RepID=A0A562URG5_9ACTN|nr:PIN domain-containing protein [Stackebrandtia albiflava]TWJ08188.1 PIN domain-containing protein [Stackebrandtia albiflava]